MNTVQNEKNDTSKKVGKRIANLRKEAGMTQEELARQIKCDRRAVSAWERGARPLDINSWYGIAQTFGVSTDYIVGTSPQRNCKSVSKTDRLDLEKLNELGAHLMYEIYHILLKDRRFCKNYDQN